jgi:Ca-activated chloride channel homolog
MRPIRWVPPVPDSRPVEVKSINAVVAIDGLHATTSLTISLENPGGTQQESVVLLPVPPQATIKSLQLDGAAGSFTATLLPKDEARRIYDEIVRQVKDPALLEFAGTGLVRSSVFPVPARGKASVRITYEELLPAESGEQGRIDYILPRSESSASNIPWTIELTWKMPGGHASLYSPSHPLEVQRPDKNSAKVFLSGQLQPGPFRLSALPAADGSLGSSLIAYPGENGEDGTFLLLLAPPKTDSTPVMKREVTIVLDRSGSMAGEKMDQARAAALQIVEGLEDGESFNIITYNEAVTTLFPKPQVKNPANTRSARDFLNAIRVSGGTNIHGALQESLAQPTVPGSLPVVLFLTDGIPTIGETFEKTIRDNVAKANKHQRRIFTFGVGADVNTPLLSRLADDSRATPTYVLPKEDVELKVVGVFRRLAGPIIAEPTLKAINQDESAAPGRITDIVPLRLPDLFANDLQVILGRYQGKTPFQLKVTGLDANGKTLATTVKVDPSAANLTHSHVPRLWATRRIAILTEALRDLGAAGQAPGPLPPDANDPRARELIDEIVKLSLRHGIMSEYTAFLAKDGTPLAMTDEVRREATQNFQSRAIEKRSGADSVNQDFNLASGKAAQWVDKGNRYLNDKLEESTVEQVKQIGDKTFYQRSGHWVDAASSGTTTEPEDIDVSDPRFKKLVDQLVLTNRQGVLALGGAIILNENNQNYRIRSNTP